MKFNQEYIAENLLEQLNQYFKNKKKLINITIEGAGVHWHCIIALKNKMCKIHCFENYHQGNTKAEYLMSFNELTLNKAWGRTNNIEEVLTSSATWLFNKGIDFLYQEYEFVDKHKRIVQFIESQLILNEPALNQVDKEMTCWDDSCYYNIEFGNRSCQLSGFGENKPISFNFQWDKSTLFEVQQNDLSLMATIVKKWLIETIKPSILRKQYEWITISDLAKYYEIGEGIKGDFIESWNNIEKFYSRFDEHFRTKTLVVNLIRKLRQKGLDEKLRAGQSLYHFILSRSRRHGLVSGQTFLKLIFNTEKNEMSVNDSSGKQILNGKIGLSNQLEQLLNNLSKEEIN